MLRLFANNTELEIAPDSTVEFVIKNPFFSYNLNQQDYSYPFSVSATSAMRRLFGHVQDRSSVLPAKDYDCTLVLGSMSRKGTLRVTEFVNNEYRAYVYLGAFSLSSWNTPLNEFDRPLTGNLATQWTNGINQLWPDTPIYFPTIYNPTFYDPVGTDADQKNEPEFTGIVNGYSNGFLWNTINGDGHAENFYAASPMPAVLEIIKLGIEQAGYTLAGDILNEDKYKKLWLYSNRGLDVVNTEAGELVYADRSALYGYDLSTSPKLSFTGSSSTQFSNDEYEYQEQGKLRVKIEVEYDTNGATINGMKVRILVNGIAQHLSGAVTDSSGQITFEQDIVIAAGDIGDKLSFDLVDTSNATINITALYAEFQIEDGENRLIRFGDPTNLKDYLPAIKFGDFFNAFCLAYQVVPLPDERRGILYLEKRSVTRTLTKSLNYNKLPYKSTGIEISPVVKKQLVGFKSNKNPEALPTLADNVWVYENSKWQFYEIEPDDFEGDRLEIGLVPIFKRKTIPNFPFSPNLTTLQINHTGQDQQYNPDQPIGDVFIGLFDGQNADGVCPAHFKTTGLDLRLDQNVPNSILNEIVAHIELLDRRSRKKKPAISKAEQMPEPYSQIIFEDQVWLWDEFKVFYQIRKPLELEVSIF